MIRVAIQAGDTLFSIAQKFLGASSRFHEITHLNGIPFTGVQANNLQVGDVVLVPVPRLKSISAPVRHGISAPVGASADRESSAP